MIKRHHLKDHTSQTAAIETVVHLSFTYKLQMFIKRSHRILPEDSLGRRPQNFLFLAQHASEPDAVHV